MMERWIIGVDGSDDSRAALRWALAHAGRAEAELVGVCAFHVPWPLALLATKRGVDVDRLGLGAESQLLLDETIAAVGGGVRSQLIDGSPAAVLLDAAADASMLIVGRRGGGGVRGRLLGSVSAHCATRSVVPVVVVPQGWGGEPCRSIAIGFDGSPNAGDALRWALAFAPESVEVDVLMAIEPAPWLSEDITLARFPDEIRTAEEHLRSQIDAIDPDERANRRVELHDAREVLARAATSTDLIVVGARGRGRVGAALLGSVSSWLLHHATCPITVVPHAETEASAES